MRLHIDEWLIYAVQAAHIKKAVCAQQNG